MRGGLAAAGQGIETPNVNNKPAPPMMTTSEQTRETQ